MKAFFARLIAIAIGMCPWSRHIPLVRILASINWSNDRRRPKI